MLLRAASCVQVLLERSFKEQQDKVEAEQAQHTATAARLASAVAYKKVNMQAAGLPLYQSVFGQVGFGCSLSLALVSFRCTLFVPAAHWQLRICSYAA